MDPALIGLLGTFLGGVIGFGGSLLSNRSSRLRQEAQLRHDAEQRNREREMSLRINVYLSAAEAVVRSQYLVVNLGNPDIPAPQSLATYTNDSAMIGKITVVGTESTVRCVTQFNSALSVAVLEVSMKRAAYELLHHKIKEQRDLVNGAAKNRDDFFQQWLSALKGNPPHSHLPAEYYQQNNNNWSQNHLDWSNELAAMEKLVIPAHIELTQFTMMQSMTLNASMNAAVLSIRKELELPLDEQEYLKMLKEAGATQQAVMDQFATKVTQLVAQYDGDPAAVTGVRTP